MSERYSTNKSVCPTRGAADADALLAALEQLTGTAFVLAALVDAHLQRHQRFRGCADRAAGDAHLAAGAGRRMRVTGWGERFGSTAAFCRSRTTAPSGLDALPRNGLSTPGCQLAVPHAVQPSRRRAVTSSFLLNVGRELALRLPSEEACSFANAPSDIVQHVAHLPPSVVLVVIHAQYR